MATMSLLLSRSALFWSRRMLVARLLLLVSAAVALSAQPALGVDYVWNQNGAMGPQEWNTPANWTPAGPPQGGDGNYAHIGLGGTAVIDTAGGPVASIDSVLFDDPTGGTVNQSDQNLTLSGTEAAANPLEPGTLRIGVFVAANNTTGYGTYNLTGTGSINAFRLQIGEDGGNAAHVSTFNQGVVGDAGGTSVTTTGRIYIGGAQGTGARGGGNGVYNLNSGTLTIGNEGNPGLTVGHNGGTGVLNIHGGTLVAPNGDAFLADNNGSVGIINQDGGTANYESPGGNWVFIGAGGTGQGTYNLSGNAVMTTGSRLLIARTGAGGAGTFNISGNASLTTGSDLDVDNGGVGVFNQSGNTTVNTQGGWLFVGTSGNAGSSGTYNLTSGTVTTGRLVVGANTSNGSNNGIGHFIQTGGSLTSTNDLSLGDGAGATGDYTISGPSSGPNAATLTSGTVVENANSNHGLLLGWAATGTMNQNGGLVTVGQAGVGFNGANAASGSGTYNLSGGILATPAIFKINVNGTGVFNFNGGTLQAVAPDPINPNFARAIFMGPGNANLGDGTPMPALTAANVQAGGAIIDSNGLNITISQPLLNGVAGTDGGLKLADSNATPGSLMLTGVNTFNGPTSVTAGTLILGNGLALQNSTLNLTVNNSVQFSPGATPFTLGGLSGGANLLLQDTSAAAIALAVGNNNSNTTYSGVLSDGAVGSSLAKIGTGTLTLTGAQSYTGPTAVNGGTLALGSTASLAGSATVGGAAATGTPTITGTGTVIGSLTVSAPNGGVAGHAAPGVSSIGTLRVGSLSLGAGSVLDYEFGAPGTGDLIASTGALTLPTAGSVTVNLTDTGGFATGTYKLITESSTTNFTATRFSIGVGVGGFQEAFSNPGGTEVDMIVTPAPTWKAVAADTNWANPANWVNGLVPGSTTGTTNTDLAAFSFNSNILNPAPDAGRNVQNITFDQAGVGAYVIGTTGGNALLLTSGGKVQTTALDGATQAINAPLVLEGADGTYTFSSNSSNNANLLNFGGGITGGAAGNTILTLAGNNTGANTITGVIGNGSATAVSLFKSGAGTWVLGGNNTFTGGVTVDGGTLRVGNSGALNSTTPNAITFTAVSTGALALNGNNVTVASLNSTGTTGQVVNGNAAPATLTINTVGNPVYNAILADGTGGGALSLTVSGGAGTSQTLSGNNTFSGTTRVTGAGTLILGSTNALQNSTLNMTVVGSVQFGPSITNFTIGGLSGNANLTLTDTAAAAINASIGNNGANTVYSGVLDDAGAGSSLIKVGTGTLTLANVPTYTGTTTVSAGTLAFGNAGPQSFGGTILGSGAVAASGPGALTLTSSNSTWSGGLNVAAGVTVTAGPWQTTTSPTASPLGTGAVTLNAGSTLNLAGAGTGAVPPPFDPAQNYTAGVNVAGNSTVNVTNSLSASMGTSSIGATLNLTGTAGASLSLGTTTLTGAATLNPAANTTLSLGPTGESGGSRTLTKMGLGTATMAAPSTYSGGTTMNQGTLNVVSSKSLGTGLVTLAGGKLALTPNTTPAISIHFEGGSNGGAPTLINATDTAGAIPVVNWNNVNSTNVSNTPGSGNNSNIDGPLPATIADSNGNATAVAISFQSNNTWGTGITTGGGPGDIALMNGYLDLNFGGNNLTEVSLKGIPFASYDVYAYVGSDGDGRTGHGTINGKSIYFITSDSPAMWTGAYVPASGTSVATANAANYLLFHSIAGPSFIYDEMGDNNNVGFHGLEIVNDETQISMANAMTVTGNATIDVTGGAAGAINGAISIGSQTLSITGGSTGPDTPYTLTLGATTLSGNPTFDVANNGMGTGTLRLASLNDGGSARTITKANAGTLEIQGASTLTSGTSIKANVGRLRFNNTSGAATVGSSVSVTVASGATLELAGTISDLSSPSPASARVNVINNSKQSSGGSLSVTGTNQQVGAITGTGDTVVSAGASLTANSIVQNALVIGGSSTSPAIVTIAASDASGNPLAASAGPAAALDSSGSVAPGGSSLLAGTDSAGGSSLGSAASAVGGGAATVPEPSTLVLLAIGALVGTMAAARHRRAPR